MEFTTMVAELVVRMMSDIKMEMKVWSLSTREITGEGVEEEGSVIFLN